MRRFFSSFLTLAAAVSVFPLLAGQALAASSLEFAVDAVTVNESAGTVTLNVTRSKGLGGAVTVDYLTASGTAESLYDYVGTSGTLSWGSGDGSPQPITVPIINDDLFEGPESFTVALSNPSAPAELGAPSVATVTIDDDDLPPTLEFAVDAVTVNESAGTVTLNVTRSNALGGAVTVNYATAPGTAVSPADFVGTAGTLSWGSGDGSPQPITVPIINDDLFEGPESFTVTLLNPSAGAELGARSVATVTIVELITQSHMPGNACAAVNLTQALRGIRWDQFRITNQSDGPLFITCPVNTAALGTADANDDGGVKAFGYVDVYFPGIADDVQCIWRQQSYDITAGSQAIFEVHTAVSFATAPHVNDVYFDLVEEDGWMDTTDDSSYQSVTCATQPGTGINAVQYYATDR